MKEKPEYVLAVDVGTASLSAVLAERKKDERVKIAKVFRHRFDLLSEGFEKKSARVILGGIKNILEEAHKINLGITSLLFSFSDLLSSERRIKIKSDRKPPHPPIRKDEVEKEIIKTAVEILQANSTMVIVKREIIGSWVNGYPVSSPENYRGQFFELDMSFLVVSQILADNIRKQKDYFFPKSVLRFYSDRMILNEALRKTENVFEPTLMVDIGGELTSIFLAEDGLNAPAEPIMFGARALERRVASFLKIPAAEAESAVMRYVAGVLDESQAQKVAKLLETALADWMYEFKTRVIQIAPHAKKTVLTGGGSNLGVFFDAIKKYYGSSSDIAVSTLKAEAFHDFFVSMDDLKGGRDVILACLILYG